MKVGGTVELKWGEGRRNTDGNERDREKERKGGGWSCEKPPRRGIMPESPGG